MGLASKSRYGGGPSKGEGAEALPYGVIGGG